MLSLILSALFLGREAFAAETIEFPDDELAPESVLPVFDHPVAVKNQNVLTKGRFEFGPTFGFSLLEPFYNPLNYGAILTYHGSETHGFNLIFTSFLQGLSSNANNLNPIPGTVTSSKPGGTNVNLQYAPAPKYLLLANYQYTGFYGKISLGKDNVMTLSVFGSAGLGGIAVGDAMDPAFDLGIGQKLYFSPSFALRFDFRFLMYQGPDILSRPLDGVTSVQPASSFSQKLNYSSLLSLSAVYLFPGM